MGRIWFFFFLLGVAGFGYWMGMNPQVKIQRGAIECVEGICPSKNFPLTENKSFAIVIYAYNQGLWCERALKSVFEQEYEYYRVIFVDDGSSDATFEIARKFIVDNQQDHRVIMIRNEERLGLIACLYRAVDTCLNKEIVIPLDAKDWFATSRVLTKLGQAYQNPDVWIAFGETIHYPSYEILKPSLPELTSRTSSSSSFPVSFYAGIFKEIHLSDLFKKGAFAKNRDAFLAPLLELSVGRVRLLHTPVIFFNSAAHFKAEEGSSFPGRAPYEPLTEFPKPKPLFKKSDILLFSYNRPMQLYACLESIERYMSGYERLSVLYRADAPFDEGYDKVKEAFPGVHFIAQGDDPKRDFKPHVLRALSDSPSEYILFGVDDIVMKDFVDLLSCTEMMEKTKAYGFYLRFGKHVNFSYQTGQPQQVPKAAPLAGGIFAWDIAGCQSDWGFPNCLDMTLYRKQDLKEPFEKLKYKTPNSLEFTWAKDYTPKEAIGLFFETSKMVNVPMNVVGRTGNPHMNLYSTEELLARFNEGLKIDIDPLYRIQNASPHHEYVPEFVSR